VAEHRTFQAFFSYAHHDAETDRRLVEALTTELEKRVTARLVNDRFVIWRDTKGLRTADLWNPAIENALRSSDLLIVLLTPRWLTSDYCRKEYAIFQEIEASASDIPLVAPISVRSLERQRAQFEPEQTEIYESLRERQYFQLLAPHFLQLRASQRSVQIEKIADDIEGILERCRQIPETAKQARSGAKSNRALSSKREFTSDAHDLNEYGFIRNAEVVLDKPDGTEPRGVYAQVDFLRRLYIQHGNARITFGVRRAVVTVNSGDLGAVTVDERYKGAAGRNYLVTLRSASTGFSICMNPEPGRRSLAELALNPTDGNYLARIATATPEVNVAKINAELRVALNTDGLYIAGNDAEMSQAWRKKIMAIMNAAAMRGEQVSEDGKMIRRQIPVQERSA
jgi:hypothetical protein